jgi:hypothetical protein
MKLDELGGVDWTEGAWSVFSTTVRIRARVSPSARRWGREGEWDMIPVSTAHGSEKNEEVRKFNEYEMSTTRPTRGSS